MLPTKTYIEEDYRKSQRNKNERFLYPLNETTNFKVNKYFRQITKNITIKEKILTLKEENFILKNIIMVFQDLILRFMYQKYWCRRLYKNC